MIRTRQRFEISVSVVSTEQAKSFSGRNFGAGFGTKANLCAVCEEDSLIPTSSVSFRYLQRSIVPTSVCMPLRANYQLAQKSTANREEARYAVVAANDKAGRLDIRQARTRCDRAYPPRE